jgi:hypothetical protein
MPEVTREEKLDILDNLNYEIMYWQYIHDKTMRDHDKATDTLERFFDLRSKLIKNITE